MNDLKWEFYQDSSNEWRWRAISSNGRIVAASSEGFSSKQNAINNARFSGYKGT